MKNRIKVIKSHIADLKTMLTGTAGKQEDRINEEIHNTQFELKQLIRRMPSIIIDFVARLRAKKKKSSNEAKDRKLS